MTEPRDLRDYFAAHALAALIISDGVPRNAKAQARAAYYMADLMLAERPRQDTMLKEPPE
jgi:hypothetical protein